MKLKFKRFFKKSLIVFIVFSFLILSLVSVSSAYTVEDEIMNDSSGLYFLSIPRISYVSNGVRYYFSDSDISKVRYRQTNLGLCMDLFFFDSVFIPEQTYSCSCSFIAGSKLSQSDTVAYGSYSFRLTRYGSFTISESSIVSYRLGRDSRNEAVVQYAWNTSADFPTITSTFKPGSSEKIVYTSYHLDFDFTYHEDYGTAGSQVSFYLDDTLMKTMTYSSYDAQYGWDSPASPPSMDNVIESGKLEDQILSDTSTDVETTKNFLTNFKIYSWLQNGLLAVTNVFEIFGKLPFFDNLLEYSLVLGIFAFIVGMTVSLLKPGG